MKLSPVETGKMLTSPCDLAAIDTAMAEINSVFQAASAEMYAQGGTQGGAQAGPDMNAGQNAGQIIASTYDNNVQDADFRRGEVISINKRIIHHKKMRIGPGDLSSFSLILL